MGDVQKIYLYNLSDHVLREHEEKFCSGPVFSEQRTKNILKVKSKGFIWPVNTSLEIGQSLAITSLYDVLVNWV